MSAPVKAEKRPRQAPCLCLSCKRLDCHGIGKPLSHVAAIRALAAVSNGGIAKTKRSG